MRTARNASFLGRAAKRFAKARASCGRMADRNRGWNGGGKGGGKAPPQKCVVTLFAARGPEEPLEPWRCVEAGGAGDGWNRGDAF